MNDICVFICPAIATGGFMLCSRVTGAALRTDNVFGSDNPPQYFPDDQSARDYVAKLNSRNTVRSYVII